MWHKLSPPTMGAYRPDGANWPHRDNGRADVMGAAFAPKCPNFAHRGPFPAFFAAAPRGVLIWAVRGVLRPNFPLGGAIRLWPIGHKRLLAERGISWLKH